MLWEDERAISDAADTPCFHDIPQVARLCRSDSVYKTTRNRRLGRGYLGLFRILLYIYMVPDDENYFSLIFTANKNWLHLEGRCNYEDLRTVSAWIGYNFSFGNKPLLEATHVRRSLGDLNGVAPGAEITLSFSKLEFYTENEYVFDLEDSSENFYYTWSELTYSPMDWFQFGIVVQAQKRIKPNWTSSAESCGLFP